MNRFQKVATKLARYDAYIDGSSDIRFYKNQWLIKFNKEKWEYPSILEMKKDYEEWCYNLAF